MRSSDFLIEHQCPQCGAPAELEETDRLFACGYCRVRSFLSAPGGFRYLLPSAAPRREEIVYFPYWRFKGTWFACTGDGLRHRFLDLSHPAADAAGFPVSLGFRSQALRLRFATPDSEATLLSHTLPFSGAMKTFQRQFRRQEKGPVFHEAFIGDVRSLVYTPIYRDGADRIVDAVLNRPIPGNAAPDVGTLPKEPSTAWLRFLPTLCPACGWDLEGARDTLTLLCRNCDSAWEARDKALSGIRFGHLPATGSGPLLYLPFWRIHADVAGVPLASQADLVRLANLPRIIRPREETAGFRFWAPAFKIRARAFLRLGSQLTAIQPNPEIVPKVPEPHAPVHPVTLPVTEGVESLKLILADLVRPLRPFLPILGDVTLTPKSYLLVYLPFMEGHHEYIQPDFSLSVPKSLLAHTALL